MKIARKISLDFLGESHKDDYISFSGLTFKEAKQLEATTENDIDSFFELLKSKFMAGQIVDDETGNTIKLTADMLEDLPVDVLTKAVERLVGVEENLS